MADAGQGGPRRPPRRSTGTAPAAAPAAGDRWAWRARVRARPRVRVAYRAAVGVVGGALVALGLATGPLPGPGGVPLVLAGLAVLATEFAWAHRLLQRVRRAVRASARWVATRPRWLRWAGSAASAAAAAAVAWAGLVLTGAPDLLPQGAQDLLDALPGVEG